MALNQTILHKRAFVNFESAFAEYNEDEPFIPYFSTFGGLYSLTINNIVISNYKYYLSNGAIQLSYSTAGVSGLVTGFEISVQFSYKEGDTLQSVLDQINAYINLSTPTPLNYLFGETLYYTLGNDLTVYTAIVEYIDADSGTGPMITTMNGSATDVTFSLNPDGKLVIQTDGSVSMTFVQGDGSIDLLYNVQLFLGLILPGGDLVGTINSFPYTAANVAVPDFSLVFEVSDDDEDRVQVVFPYGFIQFTQFRSSVVTLGYELLGFSELLVNVDIDRQFTSDWLLPVVQGGARNASGPAWLYFGSYDLPIAAINFKSPTTQQVEQFRYPIAIVPIPANRSGVTNIVYTPPQPIVLELSQYANVVPLFNLYFSWSTNFQENAPNAVQVAPLCGNGWNVSATIEYFFQ